MENLNKLLFWRGIASNYYDYKGEDVTVSLENRAMLLSSMGIDTNDEEMLSKAVYDLEVTPWLSWLSPTYVLCQDDHVSPGMNFHPDELDSKFRWSIRLENGGKLSGEFTPSEFDEIGNYVTEGARYSRRAVHIGQLSLGYHQLKVEKVDDAENRIEKADLAIAPSQAYAPEEIVEGKRLWGVVVQLYTLRSERDWGIGDFSDLKLLIQKVSGLGADIIGLNPLHALRIPVDENCSPYSPSDRRFLDPLYIDPCLESEFEPSMIEGVDLNALREKEHVSYAEVFELKRAVFNKMYTRFLSNELATESDRYRSYNAYVEEQGDELLRFALHQISLELDVSIDLTNSEELASAAERYKELVGLNSYLQWIAARQLADCQQYAEDCGMKIGLMRDLAVGADSWGAEVKSNLDLFCPGVAVGAPPDPLAEKGQNWGLPPMDPSKLKESKFKHFISLLQHNLKSSGALRIDHAMALMRLWWCPPGKTADYGAYIYYPFEEMLGLLKLESVRNKSLIVGEDMGVVPHEFRQALIDGRIFTNKLFYFEKEHDGQFRMPEYYDAGSLAMLTNHDVPTLASWWAGTDLTLRSELDLFQQGVNFEDIVNQRVDEKHKLLDWLVRLELYECDDRQALFEAPLKEDLAAAIMIGGAKCASQLFVLQLEDLELMDAPVNVPGTSTEYANWQRKLGHTLETLFDSEHVTNVLRNVTEQRQ